MTVTATDRFGLSDSVEVTIAVTPATGLPTIAGVVLADETLTADTGDIADGPNNPADYNYQWLRDDAAITAATASTYTLTGPDAGAAIKVRVSFTNNAGLSETRESAPTATVEGLPAATVTATAGASVAEGTTATFTLARTGTLSLARTLDVTMDVSENGDMVAAAGKASQTVRFTAGVATATLRVATVDDSTEETDSTITATVESGAGYVVGSSSSATVEVTDNDPGAPTGVRATAGNQQVTLAWTAPADYSDGSNQFVDAALVEWASSDPAVVEASDGGATAVGAGNATLTGFHEQHSVEVAVSVRISMQDTGSVRLLYAAPAEREFRADYSEYFQNTMVELQSWYRQQLGGLTFSMQDTKPQECRLPEPLEYYGRHGSCR